MRSGMTQLQIHAGGPAHDAVAFALLLDTYYFLIDGMLNRVVVILARSRTVYRPFPTLQSYNTRSVQVLPHTTSTTSYSLPP
jgi:hypothetical protein